MNLTAIVHLKEKIAISEAFTPQERDFILEAINVAIEVTIKSRISDEMHAAGRTKAGNDVSGL